MGEKKRFGDVEEETGAFRLRKGRQGGAHIDARSAKSQEIWRTFRVVFGFLKPYRQ